MSSITDEIKSRLDIIEVIGEYLQLRQAGTNWRASCPFHNEKTPSFMVSRDKQIWHCFGCGEGGDVFGFVMKIEGVEFPEALRILAQKAGVVLKRQDPALVNQRTRLLDLLDSAARFYHRFLREAPEAAPARDYLKERKLTEETVDDFFLGYAPDAKQSGWETLIKFLIQKGYSDNEIFLAGLSVKKERGVGFYDRFRGRIIFPIRDVHGAIVGFTARVLPQFDDGQLGKYINTPQTMVYNKSQILYGLDRAKSEIRKQDLAVMVEGNMDVIASHQAGVTNVVASSGTALTTEQIKLIKRYSNNLAIAFDTDPAGETAAERGIEAALAAGLNIRVVIVPQGKDPDECIKKDPADWIEAIQRARSIMDYYFEKTLARADLSQVEDKKKVAKILLGVIAKIPDGVEQTHWLQKLSELLKVPEQILREAIVREDRRSSQSAPIAKPEIETKVNRDRGLELGRRLLGLLIKFPKHLEYVVNRLEPEAVNDPRLQDIYKELVIYYTESGELGFVSEELKQLLAEKNQILANFVDVLEMLIEKEFSEFDSEAIAAEITKCVRYLKQNFILREIKQIEEEIKTAEKNSDQSRLSELLKEFNQLTEELVKLN